MKTHNRIHTSAVYSNRRKMSARNGMGRRLTSTALVFSCLALAIIPVFFVSELFLPATQTRAPGALHNLAEPINSFVKLEALKSFRSKVLTTHLSRPPTEGKFEYVSPDRFHGIFDSIEMLAIGASTFVRTTSKWIPVNVKMGLCFVSPVALRTSYQSAIEQQYLGDDIVDGVSTSLFRYKLSCSDSTESVRLWISNAATDSLPRKLESTAENGTKTIVTFYDFNANIIITTPTP